MGPAPATTLAVILGASEFPKSPKLQPSPNTAFSNSAAEFQRYLLDADGFGLPRENLLDLFNSGDSSDRLDDQLREFLDRRVQTLNASGSSVEDVIVYYVGHGGFVNPGDAYYLALRNTNEENAGISGYPIQSLAKSLRDHLRHERRYLILDCCFSAAAFESFQASGPLEVARKQTQEELPPSGTALLCAAAKSYPAKAPPGQTYTMFSGALLDVLDKGVEGSPAKLSLFAIGERASSLIKERFPDIAVRPEVHAPDQRQGNLARVELFPVRGRAGRTLRAVDEALTRLVARLDQGDEARESLRGEISKLGERIRQIEEHGTGGEALAPAQEEQLLKRLQSELQLSPGTGTGDGTRTYRDLFLDRKRRRAADFDLTLEQWENLPTDVKARVLAYNRHRRTALMWLYATAVLCAVTVMLTGWDLFNFIALNDKHMNAASRAGPSPPRALAVAVTAVGGTTGSATISVLVRRLNYALIVVCGALLVLSGFSLWLSGYHKVTLARSDYKPEPWDSYEVVIESDSYHWLNVAGLEMEKQRFIYATLCYFATTTVAVVSQALPWVSLDRFG